MKMVKNYLLYLLQEYSSVNIHELSQYVKNEIISSKKEFSYKEESNRIVISLDNIEKSFFNNLANKISNKFNYDIKEFSISSHVHLHLEFINEDYEIIHAFIIYLTQDDTWEVYYSDGIFIEKIQPIKGTINEETYFLFAINTEIEEELENYFTPFCEDWVDNQS